MRGSVSYIVCVGRVCLPAHPCTTLNKMDISEISYDFSIVAWRAHSKAEKTVTVKKGQVESCLGKRDTIVFLVTVILYRQVHNYIVIKLHRLEINVGRSYNQMWMFITNFST